MARRERLLRTRLGLREGLIERAHAVASPSLAPSGSRPVKPAQSGAAR
jgi:hypothetical protein